MGFILTIIIGFFAGIIAKFLMPGRNEPQGFVLTTILGIIGAFVGAFLGRQLGLESANDGVGIIGGGVIPDLGSPRVFMPFRC